MLVAFRVIQPEQRNATARIIREKISGHALRLVPFVMNGLAFLVFVRGIEVVFRPWIEEQVERNGLANLPVEEPAYDGGGVDAVGIESAEEGNSISVRGALVFMGVVILRRVVVFWRRVTVVLGVIGVLGGRPRAVVIRIIPASLVGRSSA